MMVLTITRRPSQHKCCRRRTMDLTITRSPHIAWMVLSFLVALLLFSFVLEGLTPALRETQTPILALETAQSKGPELGSSTRKMLQKKADVEVMSNFRLKKGCEGARDCKSTVETSARRVPTGPNPLHHRGKPSKHH